MVNKKGLLMGIDLKELDDLFKKGICWECGRNLIVDFLHPDKDNWVLCSCPNCTYKTYVPRLI